MKARIPKPVRLACAKVRCVIYVRCASATQAVALPLAAQLSACEAYAAQKGWEIASTCTDKAVSGRAVPRSFDGIMAAAKGGAFDVLLIEDLSRLSRDASHLHLLLVDLKALGVAVHTVSGGAMAGLEVSARRFMVMRSIKEVTAKKPPGWDRKIRSRRGFTTNKRLAL